MAKFKVVLLKHGYADTRHEHRIIEEAQGELQDTNSLAEEDALAACEDADAILVRWLPMTPAVVGRLRRCKIIVRYGVGYDNVDLEAATQAGIMVGHVPRYCTDEVSTHAIALLLACVRHVARRHRKLADGGWEDNPTDRMYRMDGRTLGLVGLGNIGQAVARKLGGWSLRLLASDPYVAPARGSELGVQLVDLERLLQESDYVSLHCPLLPETRHLIDTRTLALMKPGSVLVNTARGPVVDNRALVEALNRGRPAQAALDVFEEEPLPPDSPLRGHPNLLLSDHAAWYSEESLAELHRTAAREAVRVCTGGLPESLANPEVLARLGRLREWTVPENVQWQLKRLERLKCLEV